MSSSSSASSSTLSNVVSSLVRASMGSSMPANVSDADLDKAVMEILLNEARSKDDKYSAAGIRAFLESQPIGTKTNKRFLTSIIRSTDEHNRAVIRSQQDAAANVQALREEAERKEKRRRATQAAEHVRKRRERSWERRGEDEAWDAWRPEDDRHPRTSKRSRSHSQERHRDHDRHRRRRSRSRSPKRSSRHDADKDKHKSHRSHRRHLSMSRSPGDKEATAHRDKRERRDRHGDGTESKPSRRHRSVSPSRSPADTDDRDQVLEAEEITLASTPSKAALSPSPGPPEPPRPLEPASPAPASASRIRPSRASPAPARHKKERPPSPAGPRPPPPPPLPPIYSKMDKYFDPNYDPRMDVELPAIPSTGLLVGDHYEGWESMLEIMRARREDKARAKWESKHGKSNTGSSSMGTASMPSALDITYSKRGATREWDMGKTLD